MTADQILEFAKATRPNPEKLRLEKTSGPARASAGSPRSGKARGAYVKAHALQAPGIETAEGCAEWLHRRIREDWGFPDPAGTTTHHAGF